MQKLQEIQNKYRDTATLWKYDSLLLLLYVFFVDEYIWCEIVIFTSKYRELWSPAFMI